MQETAGSSGSAPVCANCGVSLGGEYCAQCGERRLHPDEHTLRHIVGEWFEAFSHGEGRLLVSLRMLLLKPGELTREYFRGRRVPYARPVALFFAVNLLFFVLTTSNTFTTPLYYQLSSSPLMPAKQALVLKGALGPQASAMERTEVMADYWALYGSIRAQINAGRLSTVAEHKAYEGRGIAASRHPAALEAFLRYAQRFDEHTEALSRALLVVLVPVLAVFLWLSLAPLRRGLPELTIFATHLWSGLLLVILLFGWLFAGLVHVMRWLSAGRAPEIFQDDTFASVVIGIAVMVYVYQALRRYFRFPRMGCVVLCAWVFVGLFESLKLYRLLLFLVAVYVLH